MQSSGRMWTVWDLKPHRKEGGESVDGLEELDEPPGQECRCRAAGSLAPSPTPRKRLQGLTGNDFLWGGGELCFTQIWPELKGSGRGSRVRRRYSHYPFILNVVVIVPEYA